MVSEYLASKSRAFYIEGLALIAGLSLWGYVAFAAPGRSNPPVLLFSLLPFLLWSALRFGMVGISTSMIVVAFLSTWGAVHGRGPFTGSQPLNNVMSLQLFLFFAVAPFVVLAVLGEEQKQLEGAFRESEKRFRLVADTAPVLIWMSEPISSAPTSISPGWNLPDDPSISSWETGGLKAYMPRICRDVWPPTRRPSISVRNSEWSTG